jgi:hypothetical protein
MSGDFLDHLNPLLGGARIDRLEQGPGAAKPVSRMPQSIEGRIVSVQRGARHAGGGSVLDLTVGGGEYTDIVVRVPTAGYGQIEGKRVVLYIDE